MSTWLASAAAAALSTTTQVFNLGGVESVTGSSSLPNPCNLKLLRIELGVIVGAATVRAWLTYDVFGRRGISPGETALAVQDITPADLANGFVSWALSDVPFVGTAIYCHVELDAGTATGQPFLYAET